MENVKLIFTLILVTGIKSVKSNKVEATAQNNAILVATSTSQEKSQTFCIQYDALNQPLPTSLEDAAPHQLVDWSHSTGCKLKDFILNATAIKFENSTVALSTGECNIFQKARNVQILKGQIVLVVNKYQFTEKSVNSTDYQNNNIPVAVISSDNYLQILLHQEPITVQLFAPKRQYWDLNMIIICLFSTLFVILGAGWSALTEFYSSKTVTHSDLLPKVDKSTHNLPNVCTSVDVKDSDQSSQHQLDVTTAVDIPESEHSSHLLDFSKDVLIPKQEKSLQTLEGLNTREQNMSSKVLANICSSVIWVVLICSSVILLYFFFNIMVYVFIAWFCLYGSYSMYQCLLPAWSRMLPSIYEISINRPACCKTKIQVRNILLYLPCLTLGIFWAIQRHSNYAWILQDSIGACLCIFAVKSIRFDHFKVLAIFLLCFLIYDIFMVFITPFITTDGDSIMMKIATGGSNGKEPDQMTESSGSREMLPLMFFIPGLSINALTACTGRLFSILGFGDIIIPGILISYNAVFDIRSNTKMVYYISSALAYLLGMVICMISLVFMKSGQPALLYLIPCTLITTVVIALLRGELRKLVTGKSVQSDQ